MDKSLFRYVWRHSRRDQIWVLAVVLLSMPFYFLTLNLPKTIVNKAIQGEGFERPDDTAKFLQFTLDVPGFLQSIPNQTIELFSGFDLQRLPYLIALSMLFLALVCANGLFKFYINVFKGRMGERMLRRLRYTLVDRVLRLPPLHFRKVKAPEVATMVKDEVEPLGGFIGDAFVQPLFLGGQAITAMTFILLQSFALGAIAAGIVLAQAVIIPRLRKRLLVLGKQRQLAARELAGRVGEIVDGINEVHVNDTSNYERADVTGRLGKIFNIRYEIFRRKFFVKFLNNFLAQITPFLFYLIGGYFAIRGSLDIGQLVAVIAAYKDLPSPIKELIDWDQQRLDVQIKYTQVIEQFDHDQMLDGKIQHPMIETVPPLQGEIAATNLTLTDDSGAKLVEGASFTVSLTEHVAAVGGTNSGAEHAAEALARLLVPTSGRLTISDSDIVELPEAVTGRRLSYVGPDVYLASVSIRENLLYGLKHAPVRPAEYGADQNDERESAIFEAQATGNTMLDINDDWIDYQAAGVNGHKELETKIIDVLNRVELDEDIYRWGLRGAIDPNEDPELAKKILQVRRAMRERLRVPPLSRMVEPFDPERYNQQATIGENLLFGTSISDALSVQNLATNDYVLQILQRTGLDETLYEMGKSIARTLIELFADLPPDHPFYEQVDFLTAEDLPLYQAALSNVGNDPITKVSPGDRAMFFRLPLSYVEPRHRLALLDSELEEKLVSARKAFREDLPEDLRLAIEFYEPDVYNASASLQDNILLGRIAYGVAEGPAQVGKAIDEVLDELNLRSAVFEVGLGYNVGTGGKRLNGTQRQKIGLARAILKNPDLLVVNRTLASLDTRSRDSIMNAVIEKAQDTGNGKKQGLFWVVARPQDAEKFDRVLVFDDGAVVESGTPQELKVNSNHFGRLIAAD